MMLNYSQTDLFSSRDEECINILPIDGEAFYFGKALDSVEADFYLENFLSTIPWKNDEVVMYGKHIITGRKVAWYADKAYTYTYSHITRQGHIWTKELLELKVLIEKITGTAFNSCLLNLYSDGSEGLGWHSDNEKEFGKDIIIASLSLGAERKFSFKNKDTKETLSLILEHGSLLLMKGETQKYWLHSLPKSKKIHSPRINLTFRRVLYPEQL
ncbi:MAG: alpha-ketoglutarate-dependent dioxygenase AlkB family protein [Candidatus Gracilibacteria bacterium]